jgi:hypothetical protein
LKWEDWMESEGADTLVKPACSVIADWIVEVYYSIDRNIVKNAWRKKNFEWN